MTEVAVLQSRLAALESSIAIGATVVTYDGGRRVEYRSLSDMYRIRDDIVKQIAAASGGTGANNRRTVASFNSGL